MAKATKKTQEDMDVTPPRGYEDTFNLSETDLEELSQQIKRDVIEGEDEKSEWIQERIKDVNAVFGIKKQADWPFKGAAKISSQMHRIMVDTMAANLVSSANAPERIIDAKPYNSASIENAKFVSDLHNTLARFEYHLPDVLDRSVHTALTESFVVLKPTYEHEVSEATSTVRRWLPSTYKSADVKYEWDTDTVTDAQGKVIPSYDQARIPQDPEELKKADLHECVIDVTKEIAKEGIKIRVVNGSDIFLPISSPGETPYEKYQRAAYVWQQEYSTVQEMEMLKEQGKVKNFELMRGELTDDIYSKLLQDVKDTQAGVFNLSSVDRHITRNIWWYGKYEYKGKLRELVVYMNYETGVILKVQVNQFGVRPFFPIVPFPVDGTPFGESLPRRVRELITELELMMNTLINMGLIKAYPPKFFDPNSGFDPKVVGNFGPNAYIPVRDPSRNVYMPPQPEDPRVLMDMIKLTMDLIERATANSDAVQGQTSPTANTTAFEVQQALVRAGVRFDIIYKRIKGQLEPMFSYIHQLLLRFMPYEKEVQIMGEQGIVDGSSRLYKIHKGEMQGAFHFTLTGNSLTEEQKAAQDAEKLFALLGQDPYVSYKPESPYYLRFNLVKHYNPIMMDKILPKPDEVAQLLRDRQQVQNEQEQQAVADAKQNNAAGQQMQMEMQLKQAEAELSMKTKVQDAQLKQQQAQAELTMKEREHDQKMRHMEEIHKEKLKQMEEAKKNEKSKAQ